MYIHVYVFICMIQVVNTAKAALNYDNMDVEHRRLLTVIREATADKRAEPTDRLILRCVLQYVAVWDRVLQCVAECCSVLYMYATADKRAKPTDRLILRCVLQCVAVCCRVLQYLAVCCSVLQCVAVCCSVLQCVV